MYRIEMNVHEKELCVQLVIYKDYTEMHGQQNIKETQISIFKENPSNGSRIFNSPEDGHVAARNM